MGLAAHMGPMRPRGPHSRLVSGSFPARPRLVPASFPPRPWLFYAILSSIVRGRSRLVPGSFPARSRLVPGSRARFDTMAEFIHVTSFATRNDIQASFATTHALQARTGLKHEFVEDFFDIENVQGNVHSSRAGRTSLTASERQLTSAGLGPKPR